MVEHRQLLVMWGGQPSMSTFDAGARVPACLGKTSAGSSARRSIDRRAQSVKVCSSRVGGLCGRLHRQRIVKWVRLACRTLVTSDDVVVGTHHAGQSP